MGIWTGQTDSVIQSSTNGTFFYIGQRVLDDTILLAESAVIDTDTLILTTGHNFAAGEYITLWQYSRFQQLLVVAINVDSNADKIQVSEPLTQTYGVSTTKVIRGNIDLNVDGSSAEVEFSLKMYNMVVPIDISAIVIQAFSTTVPDDGKFAGITALANGIYFQRRGDDGIASFGNYQKNIDFKLRHFNATYTDKAPSSGYGTELVLDVEDVYKSAVRLGIHNNQYISGKIRDDLTGLALLRVAVIGGYTFGE